MKKFHHEVLGTNPGPARINSKQKGNANEREVAKILSSWTGAKFARTPMSGGLHWDHEAVAGDVVCVTRDFDFIFSVETKHYADVKLKESAWMEKVLTQAIDDALEAGKYPMVLLRKNRMPRGEYYLMLNVAQSWIVDPQIRPRLFEAFGFYAVYASDLFDSVSYEAIYNYLKST